jgi:hypothetical protein
MSMTAQALLNTMHKSETWRLHSTNCCVEVVHWLDDQQQYTETGPHRWAVYAYIYPQHPHFARFSGNSGLQPATQAMPLHGGATFLRYQCRTATGEVSSVKVGADYNHLFDEAFTFYATPEQAVEVFDDAAKLLDWLEQDFAANLIPASRENGR